MRFGAERSEQLATGSTERLGPSDSSLVLITDATTNGCSDLHITRTASSERFRVGFANVEVLDYREIPARRAVAPLMPRARS